MVAATRGSIELRGRVHDAVSRRVNVLALDVDGVIILVLICDSGIENTRHGQIEALALIVARGATNGGSTWSTTLSLAKGPLPRGLGAAVAKWYRYHWRTRVHIRVLQLDGVIILVPLVDLCIGLDTSRVGADKSAIVIISRRSPNSGTASLGMEVMLVLCIGLASAPIHGEGEDIHVQQTWPGQQLPAVPQGFRR